MGRRRGCPTADVGCLALVARRGRNRGELLPHDHAEINAIAQAAKNGAAISGASIYITHTPCIHCLKVLVNTGIKHVYYEHEYKLHTLEELRRYTDVTLERVVP